MKMDKKYKIGIWLNCKAHAGGTFQYNLLALLALSEIIKTDPEKYELYCFSPIKEWEGIIEENVEGTEYKFIYIKKNIIHQAFSWISRKTDTGLKVWRNINCFFPFAYGEIYEKKIDLMICPSQDALSYEIKVPTVAAIHDLMHRYESHFPEAGNKKEYNRRERHYTLMCRFASILLVDSQVGKQHVKESYGHALKSEIMIIPYLPPPYILRHDANKDYSYIKKKYDLFDNYIFYPAQFWMHKNHLRLIEAINSLKENGLMVNAVFVGSAKNNSDQVIQLIDKLGLNNQVKILNYVSNEEIIALYKNALALVMPTFFGPTNIPVLEALYLGVPVLCSDIYAMPEQVGDAGLFFNPESVEDIADKIRLIWTDDSLRKELIEKSHKYGNNMTIESCAEKLRNVISSVLN